MVLFPCSSCCGCEICEHSPHDCLSLTLSGFDGPPGDACDECKHLDGTYVLRRFDLPATITASIVPTVYGIGSGATVEATLSMDAATEEYTISAVTVKTSGSGYTSGAKFAYSIKNAAASPCGGEPAFDVVVGRVRPSLTASVESATGKSASLEASISGPTGKANEEVWGVSGVTIKSAGHSYRDQDTITFTVGKGVTEQSPAKASVSVNKEEPSIYASVDVGYAELSVTLASKEGEDGVWEVNGVDAAYYSGPYIASQEVAFSLDGYGVVLEPAKATFSATAKVSSLTITDGGGGYKTAPTVVFSGGSGSGAAASATVRGGVGDLNLNSGGSGYTENPTVSFSGGGGSGAMAAAYADGGQVTKVSLTSPGFGYESAPSVTISGGGGTGATATASIDGSVISINLISQGSGYTEPPGVSFLGGGGTGAAAYSQIEGTDVSVAVSTKGEYYGGGQIESITIEDDGEYYLQNGVQSVDIIDGGSFWPTPFCEYTWRGCAACCENNKMDIKFVAGGEKHRLTARTIDTIFDAEVDADGGDWTSLSFGEDSFYPGVESIAVTAGGSGYTSPPNVVITGDGSGAEATATVRGYVDSITLTKAGSGYTSSPTVTISGGGGSGATATAVAGHFTPLAIYLGAGGTGYTSPPTVTISGGGGSGATAVATVRQAVDSVVVTKAGSGYSAAPAVTFSGGGGNGAVAEAALNREPVGCYTSGTAEIAPAACDDESELEPGRELPDQISMTLSGIAPIFWWASQNGGSPPGPCAAEGAGAGVFCGRCGDSPQEGILYRVVGNAFGPAGFTLQQAIDNFSVVLDREQPPSCQTIIYSGYTTSLPSAGYAVVSDDTSVSCGGELNVPVSLALSCVPLATAVSISSPTKGVSLEGASAEITGVSDGVVSGLTLTNPGSGYAVEIVERVEPEVEAGVSTAAGFGGELSVSLSETTDYDGNKAWTVDSVTVSAGGEDYAPSESVYFSTSDESYYYAEGHITVVTTEPTLSASASGGIGAELSVTLAETSDYFGNKLWAVGAVTVDAGGSGYADGSAVTFTVDDGSTQSAASATIATAREEPEVTATVESWSGSGAVLAVTLTQSGNSWYASSVAVTNGGSGYDAYDYVVFATDDAEASPAYAAIATDENGVITSVSIYGGGSYYRSTDVIESVSVSSGGGYYKSDGAIESVVVSDGGLYWRLQGTGQADVDEPVVTISGSYGVGSGATAEATIDTAIGSPTFGQISSLTLTSGGSGYRTEGSGWRATVSIGRLAHRTECLVFGVYSGCDEDGGGCPGFADSYKEPESERVTDSNYPTPLINKAYKMAFAVDTRYGEIANAENAVYCTSGPYAQQLVIVDMGLGDIVVTLAPA